MSTDEKQMSRIRDPDVLLQILDQLPTSIFVKNEELRFELSNTAHNQMAGAGAGQLLGHGSDEFHLAEEAQIFMSRDRQVLEHGETQEWEETVRNSAGEDIPYLTRRSRLVAADGKVYLIGTSAGLSEVRKREMLHRTLAETVPVGIWQVNEAGHTIFVNPLMLSYLGAGAAGIEKVDIGQQLGGGRPNFPGEACRFETDLASASGHQRRVLVISSGWLSLTAGDQRAAIVSAVDIPEMTGMEQVNDEISRLNRELADHMRRLKEAQDEIMRKDSMSQLGQLTTTVAHEIRNPLGAVRTALFLIERKVKDKPLGIETHLQRIGNGITRCDNIITQLLDFSRSRNLQLETVTVDEWVAAAVAEEAERLPASLTIECNLGLGNLASAIDGVRMTRVMANLIGNACEAMIGKASDPEALVAEMPKIIVETRRSARGIEISVSDNGPGISAENQKKVLDPFFTTKSFGTGLGLPAVERILQEHGGGLLFESSAETGATFTAWFPVHREAAAA